ncbi:hypothetical protein PQX77_021314 [Marasmius sp. AFHP31]|nr:hypothetical protein PQX77_021314 [Marasmius sp. AFHP31]
MPRLKLYHTKAERREANRIKNKRFYNKHRKDILYSKQLKRDEERREIYRETIQTCKKRKDEREKQPTKKLSSIGITPTKEPGLSVQERLSLCLSELETKLDAMKAEHLQAVAPDAGHFCQDLCQQAVLWKQATQLPLMKRCTTANPIILAKNGFEAKLQEYQLMEDEYLYAIRDKTGRTWDGKREEFVIYKEVVSQLVEVLNTLLLKMDTAGNQLKFEDLETIYRTSYSFYFSSRR